MNKKHFVNFAIIFLAAMLLLSLCACEVKLNGTYKNGDLVQQSFSFQDNGQVTMSAFGINANGTYKIEDGKITITYSLLGFSYDWTKDFEKKGNSIIIDGTEFVKQ